MELASTLPNEPDMRPPIRPLIVEDDPAVAEDLRQRLEGMGFDVMAACRSSEEAIESCARELPDVVLLDICLATEMDGIEAARVIRKRFDVPFLFLSAYFHHDLAERAMETAPYGYLVKPFDSRAIKSTILTAISRHANDRAMASRKRLLEAIVASLAGAVIATDPAGKVIYLNEQARVLTGIPIRGAMGRPLDELVEFMPVGGPPAIPDESAGTSTLRSLVARDDRETRVAFARLPLVDHDGTVLGSLLTFRPAPEA